MSKTIKFYDWFTGIGGMLSNNQLENVDKIVNNIPLQITSTLKHRAEEIKNVHNYKFK